MHFHLVTIPESENVMTKRLRTLQRPEHPSKTSYLGFSSLEQRATLTFPASNNAGSSGEFPKLEIPFGHADEMNKSTPSILIA